LSSYETQRVIKFCENRQIKKLKVQKLGWFARSKDTIEAWYNLDRYMQKIKGWAGNYWLPVGERYAIPISPYSKELYEDEEWTNILNQSTVADESCNFTRMENENQMHKSRYYDYMGIAVMGVVVCFIIMAILVVLGHVGGG